MDIQDTFHICPTRLNLAIRVPQALVKLMLIYLQVFIVINCSTKVSVERESVLSHHMIHAVEFGTIKGRLKERLIK